MGPLKKRERLICIFFSSPDSFPPSNSALSLLRAAPAGCLDVARRDLSRRWKVSVPSPGEFSFVAAASGVPGRTGPFCVCLPGMVCTPLALRGHWLVFFCLCCTASTRKARPSHPRLQFRWNTRLGEGDDWNPNLECP